MIHNDPYMLSTFFNLDASQVLSMPNPETPGQT